MQKVIKKMNAHWFSGTESIYSQNTEFVFVIYDTASKNRKSISIYRKVDGERIEVNLILNHEKQKNIGKKIANAIKKLRSKPINELFPQGDALVRLVRENVDNTYVVVYDQGGEILSAMMFDDLGTYFNVEFLLANRLFNPQSAGTKLILLLEDLGRKLNYDRIELWSLANKVDYYLSLGYTNTELVSTGRYGKMFRMVKSLR